MSNNPTFGHVSHPKTRSTARTNEGEPVKLNVQGCITNVKHIPLKENPAAPNPKNISFRKEQSISDVVTAPATTQLPQNMEKSHMSNLPRPRFISTSIDGEGMKSTSMHIFKFTLNQLLQNKRKTAEFNQRVPKPKGPRPPPASWGKPANREAGTSVLD